MSTPTTTPASSLSVVLLADDDVTAEQVRDAAAELAVPGVLPVGQVLLVGGPDPGPAVPVDRVPDAAGRADALRAALERVTGSHVLLHDVRDRWAPGAVATLLTALAADPAPDLLYADEVDAAGRVVLKPDWSPERLRHEAYVGRPVVLAAERLRRAQPLDLASAEAAEYDLVLRAGEAGAHVVHLRTPLVHRSGRERLVLPPVGRPWAGAEADADARRALTAHLERVGTAATVHWSAGDDVHHLERRLDPQVTVSLVIPTRGQRGTVDGRDRVFVVEAVRSALAHTDHPAVEVVVVHDTVTPAEVLDELRSVAGDALVLVQYDQPFNYSEKCNLGSLHASGDVLVLLNDDTEVTSARWLETLVAPLQDAGTGMTGALLRYEDGSVQFAGHVYSAPPPRQRHWRHLYHHADAARLDTDRDLRIDREVSGVTGACAAVRRDVWTAVGGLTELLPLNYNDVDLCLKVLRSGARIVWVSGVRLRHFESKSRIDPRARPEELALLERRWGRPTTDAYWPWPDP